MHTQTHAEKKVHLPKIHLGYYFHNTQELQAPGLSLTPQETPLGQSPLSSIHPEKLYRQELKQTKQEVENSNMRTCTKQTTTGCFLGN